VSFSSGPLSFIQNLVKIIQSKPRVPESLQDNPLLHTILSRRSVRRFSQQEIPDDVFQAILEAGRLAPSGVNIQSWTFLTFTPSSWEEVIGTKIPFRAQRAVLVLADMHRIRRLVDAYPGSPLVEYTFSIMNASIAAMNMNIAAEALGVSSVMLSDSGRSGLLDVGYLKEKLQLPAHVFPILTLALGYMRGSLPPIPPRFPMEALCFEGPYREVSQQVLDDWVSSLADGFRAAHPLSSLEKQLKYYTPKIVEAEGHLNAMIFNTENEETGGPPPRA
jgi:nitroreductase